MQRSKPKSNQILPTTISQEDVNETTVRQVKDSNNLQQKPKRCGISSSLILVLLIILIILFESAYFYTQKIIYEKQVQLSKIESENSNMESEKQLLEERINSLEEQLKMGPKMVTPSSKMTISPNKCESTQRGHFEKIYKDGVWGAKVKPPEEFYGDAHWPLPDTRMKSASGPGSELGVHTETSLERIKNAIINYNIQTMVDIPCGDVNWIMDSYLTDTLSLYVGLDITSSVIEVNKKRFGHHTNKEFHFWDATECVLPRIHAIENTSLPQNKISEEAGVQQQQQEDISLSSSFDLIHIRDVIQHMPLKMGVQFFCNVFKSKPKYMMTTMYPNVVENVDIDEGGFYQNNLFKEPFSFPKTDRYCFSTHPTHEPDYTCLFDLSERWVEDFIKAKC